jgi:hypothetical protein
MTEPTTPQLAQFTLHRNALQQLVLTNAQDKQFHGCIPVRAFPLGAPEEGISIVSNEGHELLWIEQLHQVPQPTQSILVSALAQRELTPRIERIESVSTFATPSVWEVQTDRGTTALRLNAEEDIRRLSAQELLIADDHGLHFKIADISKLDRHSRKLLERFL